MSIVIRAEDEPVPTRLDYLRHAVRDTIVPFDLQVDAEPNFRSLLVAGNVGTLDLTAIAGPSLEAARTPRLIRRSDPELMKIDVQTRGNSVFEQDGREAALSPRDLTLVNLSRPCHLACTGEPDQEIVAVKFPRTLLPVPAQDLTRLTAVRIGGSMASARSCPRSWCTCTTISTTTVRPIACGCPRHWPTCSPSDSPVGSISGRWSRGRATSGYSCCASGRSSTSAWVIPP
jgi:hypothetical protein